MGLFKLIHLLAVLAWVGGMFFAYVILRPAALEALDVPQRLRLWDAVLQRFFKWVWIAAGILLVSGLYMIYLHGGVIRVSHNVHIMLVLGIVMMTIYAYVFFVCYIPFSLLVTKQKWKEAGERLITIRKLVGLNLILGILNVCIAKSGMI